MESILRGIQLPIPKCREIELSNDLKTMNHYKNLESTIPPMLKIFDIKNEVTNLQFDNNYSIRAINFKPDNTIKGNCNLKVNYKGKTQNIESYMKVTHLLDPVYFLQEKYTFDEMKKKLESEWNQAYVETVASYIVGKLRQEDVTPHFNLYYGAFKSIAEKYSYNITDEVETYRKYKWFWNGIEKGDMSIDVEVDDEVIKAELLSEIMEKPEYCIELNHDDSLEEQLETLNINKDVSDELQDLESIHSFSIKTVEEDNNEEEDDDDKEVISPLDKI